MTLIELNLTPIALERLQDEAQRRKLSINALVNEVLTAHFEDDEPTKEEILANLRQGMIDALKGNVRPADEVLDEIEAEYADQD